MRIPIVYWTDVTYADMRWKQLDQLGAHLPRDVQSRPVRNSPGFLFEEQSRKENINGMRARPAGSWASETGLDDEYNIDGTKVLVSNLIKTREKLNIKPLNELCIHEASLSLALMRHYVSLFFTSPQAPSVLSF